MSIHAIIYVIFGGIVLVIVASVVIIDMVISSRKSLKGNHVEDQSAVKFYKTNYEAAERKIEVLNKEIDVLQSETWNLPRLRVGDYVYYFASDYDGKPECLRRVQIVEIRWSCWHNHREVEYICIIPDCDFPSDVETYVFDEEDIGKTAFPAKDRFYENLFLSGKSLEEKEKKDEKTEG